MTPFRYNPALPPKAPKGAFAQTIELANGRQVIGSARWSAPADVGDGVIQLISLHILPPHRRGRHGSHLLQAVIDQARRYQRLRRAPLRRIWTGVEQKSQIAARAFLTENGFHHVATVNDLYKDQDLLIYMRSFD